MVYGLIVPVGVPAAVAEALEGTHGNPQVDELQSRLALREYLGASSTTEDPLRVVFLGEKRMRDCYATSEIRTRWARLGEQHGCQ